MTGTDRAALEEIDFRLRVLLPEEYQDSYQALEPAPMRAAGLKFDADGRFIRQYLPELARVPERYVHAPWTMSAEQQEAVGVKIGRDYPAPIVDHAQARAITLKLYAEAAAARG